MAKVYFISGLGADRRAFHRIKLHDVEMVFVDWIEPDKRDTIATYASKLITAYDIKPGVTVVGLSLGGVMAIEINKQIGINKAILISSIKNSNEAPAYFKLFRQLPVFKLLTGEALINIAVRVSPVLGKLEKGRTDLITQMMRDSSPGFVKWAMGAILKWRSHNTFNNVYQIIGDKDKVFNHGLITDAAIVKGGTHIMVYNRATEVSAWLQKVLTE